MKERLDIIEERYNYLEQELLKHEVYNDYKKMQGIIKEKNALEKTVDTTKKYNTVLDDIEAAKEMAKDPEMREFANEELDKLHLEKEQLEEEIIETSDHTLDGKTRTKSKDYFYQKILMMKKMSLWR